MARKQPISGKKTSAIKPEQARKLINQFHALNKLSSTYKEAGELAKCEAIDKQIADLGGLKTYQAASICGQSSLRGGDSSKILLEMLAADFRGSMLEVGCLQVDNACARSNRFKPHTRIDLNSQHPKIEQTDFMKMTKPSALFDIISLSLVVNYVPVVQTRGEMLVRVYNFLTSNGLLFFVLPRACTDNSRYCNDVIINQLFTGIGFRQLAVRKTTKLVYWLFEKTPQRNTKFTLAKTKVRDGSNMNNFTITL